MRITRAILVVMPAFLLAGCIVGARPRIVKNIPPPPVQQPLPAPAPAAAPGPLSSPQTNAEVLPPPQPLNPEAVAAAQPPEQAAPPPAPPRNTASRPRQQHAGPPAIPAPRTEPEPPAPAPAATPAPIESGSRIQEILPASEQKRLQEEAAARKREVRQWLAQSHARRLSSAQNNLRNTVESYLKLSDDKEALGDMRQADDLALRAWILARDLQSGR
jgi:hypothetical protein